MADVGPIDILQESNKELAFPIIRDMDTFCYERQSSARWKSAATPTGPS
jgi:hypothetical protein